VRTRILEAYHGSSDKAGDTSATGEYNVSMMATGEWDISSGALSLEIGGEIGMTELLVEHPPTYEPERRYIYDVMFGKFLGITYQARIGDDPCTTAISVCGDSSRKHIILHEALFSTPYEKWLTGESLPRQPLDKWMVHDAFRDIPRVSSDIPVIYGQHLSENSYYEEFDGGIRLGLDIFGSSFFMLTRYEEVVKSDRDEHDRFPAVASLAYQEGFLERPIVNEYLEILWACMKRLWPEVNRRRREYEVLLSCDVDSPLAVCGKSWSDVLLSCGADMLRRRDLYLSGRRFYAFCCQGRRNLDVDPYNTFDFAMNVSEQYGLASAFYFMAVEDDRRTEFDGLYSIEHAWIRKLMRRISRRGHEVGFHGSYGASVDRTRIEYEVEALRAVMQEEGIDQPHIGGRMHYLRWSGPCTWRLWEDAGLDYDSSLAFAEHTGFRFGSCYSYPVFDVTTRQPLLLVEKPLITMEVSMLSPLYMNLNAEGEVYNKVSSLRERIRPFRGQFVLLWHNNNLAAKRQRNMFKEVVAIAKP